MNILNEFGKVTIDIMWPAQTDMKIWSNKCSLEGD